MTRLRGTSVSSPEVAPTVSIDKVPTHHAKLPPNAPRVIVENTIEIQDPGRVLPWYRDERRRQFNLLVRRYKNQILHGCQNPDCHTPTCASFRKRTTEGPYRRYTDLSARTLACYLASLDNAEDGLCRNPPRVPTDFPSEDYMRRANRESRGHKSRVNTPIPGAVGVSASQEKPDFESTPTNEIGQTGPNSFPSFGVQVTNEDLNGRDRRKPSARRMKDPKSFTQNLFDTLALRMVEWLPLRRSPDGSDVESTYSGKSTPKKPGSPRSQTAPETPKSSSSSGRNASFAGIPESNPQTPSSVMVTTSNGFADVKTPSYQVKRRSVADIDHWRHTPRYHVEDNKPSPDPNATRKLSFNAYRNKTDAACLTSPPALKHRPQKHRSKTGDADAKSTRERKKGRRVSWDGSKLLNDVLGSEKQTPGRTPEAKSVEDANPLDERSSDKDANIDDVTKAPGVQTITHLSPEIVDGFTQMLMKCDEDTQRWRDEQLNLELTGGFGDSDFRFSTAYQRQAFSFIAQSVFYVLSSTRNILLSFRKDSETSCERRSRSCPAKLDLLHLESSLSRLFSICPWDVALHSLWDALEELFVPPKHLSQPVQRQRRSSRGSSTGAASANSVTFRPGYDAKKEEYLSDPHAAYIATMTLFTLISSVPKMDADTWRGILQMRAAGSVVSEADMQKLSSTAVQTVVDVTDKFEHEPALRLVNRLVRAITARLTFHEIAKCRQVYTQDSPKQRKTSTLDLILDYLSEHHSVSQANHAKPEDASIRQQSSATIIVEWLRTLFLREWDGKPETPRSSATGGVLQILSSMYKERNRLGLAPEDFHTSFLVDRLEAMDMPVEWLGRMSSNKTLHVLSYSFLFPPSALVIYFRAMNFSAMSKYYEAALTTSRHVTQTLLGAIGVANDLEILERLKTSMSTFLVLTVRRSDVLLDALNQLWRRERRELMRPLKVQMGMDEGEEGVDHGGVQQEFFRVVMAESLDPAYGMFTMDSRTRISWFQPRALEPLYKFELLGLLMSLAVYNGLTLPVNFPTALYRKLLGLKVKHLDHIRDGWPDLAKGLEELLNWTEEDVGEVFMRTYEFSFEAFGRVVTVDMQAVGRDAVWPRPPDAKRVRPNALKTILGRKQDVKTATSSAGSLPTGVPTNGEPVSLDQELSVPPDISYAPTEEAALVTNLNRHQFVKDYIFWLTDKSIRPQYESFARGFYTCLDRSALSIFTPEALKTVVEGFQEIDISELERHARYEGGFGPSHRVIQEFWSIARRFSPEKKAQLLEFVTASDRVPVNGIASIMFVIQRNGVGDARLPSSLTCFGRLLLPEYSSKAILEEKLNKALENARGFGVA